MNGQSFDLKRREWLKMQISLGEFVHHFCLLYHKSNKTWTSLYFATNGTFAIWMVLNLLVPSIVCNFQAFDWGFLYIKTEYLMNTYVNVDNWCWDWCEQMNMGLLLMQFFFPMVWVTKNNMVGTINDFAGSDIHVPSLDCWGNLLVFLFVQIE